MSETLYPCPACGFLSIAELREYEICEVCGWEDDPVQLDNPSFRGGANLECLHEVQAVSLQRFPIGVMEARIGYREHLYKRDPDWRPIEAEPGMTRNH